jgi:putative ABC transport system permease protein
MMTVGATVAVTRWWLAWQMAFLAGAAAVVAWPASRLVLPWIPALVGDYLPGEVELGVPLGSLLVAALMAAVGAGCLTWPVVHRLGALRPAELFREHGSPSLELTARGVLAYGPALVVFLALSVWQTRSFVTGSLFTGLMTVAVVVASGVAWFGLRLLSRTRWSKLTPRLVVRHLSRARVASLTSFVAIALAALLASLVPQVRTSLAANLERPQGAPAPALFLFDIQEEQLGPLEELLGRQGLTLHQKSPLIRARLSAINGAPIESGEAAETTLETRERDTERRSRSRAYNLSYREGLSASESLVEGRLFAAPAVPGAMAEITLEQRFAARIGVGLGDRLTFDVQGVDLEAQVVGLRAVRWASFEPNFFVQFQPEALADAPKVFLGAVAAVPSGAREALQAELVAHFPNVSVIDVSRALALIEGVLDQIGWAMAAMAGISLLAGLVLVFAIARDQARARRAEIGLLKVLGASFGDVRRALDLEFVSVALAASLVGVGVTVVGAAVVSRVVFGVVYRPDLVVAAATVFAVTLATFVVARLASRSALATSPMVLLRERR